MQEIYLLIQKGKWINWIIVTLSIFSMMIIIERAFFFYKSRFKIPSILKWLHQTALKEEEIILKSSKFPYPKSLFASIYSAFINQDATVLTLSALEQGEAEIAKMERGLWVLREIGHIAPLLGLLGTVLGLIDSFAVFAQAGDSAEVSLLAEGIWAAMITTASGLMVAIPSFAFYKVYEKIVDKRVDLMNLFSSKLCEAFKKGGQKSKSCFSFKNSNIENSDSYGDPLNEAI